MVTIVDSPLSRLSHVMSTLPSPQPTPSRTRRRSKIKIVSTFPSNVLVLVSRLMPTHCENRKISLRLAEIDFSCKIFVDALSFFLRDWRLCSVLQGVLGTAVGAPKPTLSSRVWAFRARSWEIPGSRRRRNVLRVLSVDERSFLSRGNGREWKATM